MSTRGGGLQHHGKEGIAFVDAHLHERPAVGRMGSLNRNVVDNGVLVDHQDGVQHEWAIGGIVHGTFAGQGAHALGQQETGTE